MQMRPKFKELRDARKYTEAGVKKILFSFARELGCTWSDEKLHEFIEAVFNYD